MYAPLYLFYFGTPYLEVTKKCELTSTESIFFLKNCICYCSLPHLETYYINFNTSINVILWNTYTQLKDNPRQIKHKCLLQKYDFKIYKPLLNWYASAFCDINSENDVHNETTQALRIIVVVIVFTVKACRAWFIICRACLMTLHLKKSKTRKSRDLGWEGSEGRILVEPFGR